MAGSDSDEKDDSSAAPSDGAASSEPSTEALAATPTEASHALSFLPAEVVRAGGVSDLAIVGSFPSDDSPSEHNFRPNPAFFTFLQATIATYGPSVGALRAAALKQGSGWLYVLDMRTPAGAALTLDDLIGAFEVKDGAFVANSYRSNPGYRAVTASGQFRFPSWLVALLRQQLPSVPPPASA